MNKSECCNARIDPIECHVCELLESPPDDCEICKGTGIETGAFECSECYEELNEDGTIA